MARGSGNVLFRPGPLGFCLRGGLLLLTFGLISLTPHFESYVSAPLRTFNAWLAHLALGTVGVRTVHQGAYVQHGTFGIEVIDECTGVSVLMILLALILAFPARWAQRLIGLLAGAALILLLNLLRLVSLFVIGMSRPDLFHDLHIFVWQGIFIFVIFLYWYVWAYRTARTAAKAEPQAGS